MRLRNMQAGRDTITALRDRNCRQTRQIGPHWVVGSSGAARREFPFFRTEQHLLRIRNKAPHSLVTAIFPNRTSIRSANCSCHSGCRTVCKHPLTARAFTPCRERANVQQRLANTVRRTALLGLSGRFLFRLFRGSPALDPGQRFVDRRAADSENLRRSCLVAANAS